MKILRTIETSLVDSRKTRGQTLERASSGQAQKRKNKDFLDFSFIAIDTVLVVFAVFE